MLTFEHHCYCCIILLIGSISETYQNFRQLHIYLSLLINYFHFNKISSKSKYHSNPMWGTLKNWRLLLFTTCDWLKCLHTKKTTFQIRVYYILFHKPAFHQLINSWSRKTQPFQCGQSLLPQNNRKWYSSYLDHYLKYKM